MTERPAPVPAREAATASYVHVGPTVVRFIEPPAATGDDAQDRHRVRLWCNRIEEAALRLLDENPEMVPLVLCTREHYDTFRAAASQAQAAGGTPTFRSGQEVLDHYLPREAARRQAVAACDCACHQPRECFRCQHVHDAEAGK